MRPLNLDDYDITSQEDLSVNAAAVLKKREGRTIKAGGLWVYDNEIASLRGSFEDGDIISVEDFDGYFMGYGFINRKSRITVRLLSRRKESRITPAFLAERVRRAWDYRRKVIDTSSCRLIFGEADFLPGLTVDKYEDILVVESLALGIDRLKGYLLAALVAALREDGVPISWTWKTVKRPAFSWTRKTTAGPSTASAEVPGSWTASLTPAPLRSTPQLRALRRSPRWTPPTWLSNRHRKMRA